jgi:hypothetical protein
MHLVTCSKVGAVANDLISTIMKDSQQEIPSEEAIKAMEMHDALALLQDPNKVREFVKLTLIQHMLRDATDGMGNTREAASARKRFADAAGKLGEEE